MSCIISYSTGLGHNADDKETSEVYLYFSPSALGSTLNLVKMLSMLHPLYIWPSLNGLISCL